VFRVPQAGQALRQCAQALAGGQINLDDKALAGKIIKFDDSGLMPASKIFGCPNSSVLDHQLSHLLLFLRLTAAPES
jgi:hypothetical protein